jgi:hypothetical protein
MKTLVFSALAVIGISLAAGAQDRLTYNFDGRIGVGWLDTETVDGQPAGFRYRGSVIRTEGHGQLDFAVADGFHLGAAARISIQKGQSGNYDTVSSEGDSVNTGAKFDDESIDLAVYVSAQPITISYGKMETAFDFATMEIEHGGSILDGGNAVWLNLGSGEGSLGFRGGLRDGPEEGPDYKTVRADLNLGDFTVSASSSRATSVFGTSLSVESAGAIWRREIEGGTVFVGAGTERGPDDRFHSASLGFEFEKVKVVFSRIHRKPLDVSDRTLAAYDTTFFGSSLSYDFGRVAFGVAIAHQDINPKGANVFAGQARALWASWDLRSNVTTHFEISDSEYIYSGGDDTEKASFSVALEF